MPNDFIFHIHDLDPSYYSIIFNPLFPIRYIITFLDAPFFMYH